MARLSKKDKFLNSLDELTGRVSQLYGSTSRASYINDRSSFDTLLTEAKSLISAIYKANGAKEVEKLEDDIGTGVVSPILPDGSPNPDNQPQLKTDINKLKQALEGHKRALKAKSLARLRMTPKLKYVVALTSLTNAVARLIKELKSPK